MKTPKSKNEKCFKKGKCLRESLEPRIVCQFPEGEIQHLQCCNPDNVEAGTLAQLVGLYERNWRCRFCFVLTGFSNLDFPVAVKYAGRGKEFSGDFHICHLRCLSIEALESGRDALLANLEDLAACNSFDLLYKKIKALVDGINGLGPMYVYDVALRIGASKGLLPDKVYLQCGARKGAENLGLDYTSPTIARADCPLEFRRHLTAYEIEDFLCIFKNYLNPQMNQN